MRKNLTASSTYLLTFYSFQLQQTLSVKDDCFQGQEWTFMNSWRSCAWQMLLKAEPHSFLTLVWKGMRDGEPVNRWVLNSHMLVFSQPHDANCVRGVFGVGISVFIVSSWKLSWRCVFIKKFVVSSCEIKSLRLLLFISDSWFVYCSSPSALPESKTTTYKSPNCGTHWWFIHVTLRLEPQETQHSVCCGFHEVLKPVKIKLNVCVLSRVIECWPVQSMQFPASCSMHAGRGSSSLQH